MLGSKIIDRPPQDEPTPSGASLTSHAEERSSTDSASHVRTTPAASLAEEKSLASKTTDSLEERSPTISMAAHSSEHKRTRTVSTAVRSRTMSRSATPLGPAPLIFFQKKRQPDFERIAGKEARPLFITSKLTSDKNEHSFSGKQKALKLGAHTKLSRKDPVTSKTFFVASHSHSEYLWMELLNFVGFNTPKCRFVSSRLGSAQSFRQNYLIASKAIKHPMPIRVFRSEEKTLPGDTDHWKMIAKRARKYHLNIEKQVVEQRNIEGVLVAEYTISGNLFCTDMAALLTSDKDVQPNGENILLVREGNRFKAHLIDKEVGPPKGKSFSELSEDLKVVNREDPSVKTSLVDDPLFQHTLSEQRLAIADALYRSAHSAGTEAAPVDKIILNPRVISTFSFLVDRDHEIGLASFACHYKQAALAIADHYIQAPEGSRSSTHAEEKKLTAIGSDSSTESPIHATKVEPPVTELKEHTSSSEEEKIPAALGAFRLREAVRTTIAQQMLRQLQLSEDFLPHIVEDLRGPCYRTFFPTDDSEYKMSEKGIRELRKNLRHELFYDLNGLRAIFEENLTGYKPDATRQASIDFIRRLFTELERERKEDNPPVNRSDIVIMLGYLLIHRETAQACHSSGILSRFRKPVSKLATIIDSTVDEFCHMSLQEKVLCKQAYKDYELQRSPAKAASDELVKASIAADTFGF